MLQTEELPYKIERHERIAETAGLRVSILTLASGDEVPWHKHTDVNDQFFLYGWSNVYRNTYARIRTAIGER